MSEFKPGDRVTHAKLPHLGVGVVERERERNAFVRVRFADGRVALCHVSDIDPAPAPAQPTREERAERNRPGLAEAIKIVDLMLGTSLHPHGRAVLEDAKARIHGEHDTGPLTSVAMDAAPTREERLAALGFEDVPVSPEHAFAHGVAPAPPTEAPGEIVVRLTSLVERLADALDGAIDWLDLDGIDGDDVEEDRALIAEARAALDDAKRGG